MANAPNLRAALASVIADYRSGEIPTPDAAHVDRWISQFHEGVRDPSPGYFGEAFKASTGLTPFRFILERRVRRAKELLLDRDIPIAEVALRVGFANQSHFTVNFKKLTGKTPSRFRNDSI